MVFGPTNKEFYSSTRAFVLTAVELVIRNLKETPITSLATPNKRIPEEELFPKGRIVYPFTRTYAQKFGIHFHRLAGYSELLETLKTDPTISKHIDAQIGTASFRFSFTAWDFIGNLLEKQLSRLHEKLEFDSDTFEKSYRNLERFFYSDSIPTTSQAPLHNFDSEIENIDLGGGLSIRRLGSTEQEALFSEHSSQFPRYDIMRLRYVVEFHFETKKLFGPLDQGNLSADEGITESREKIGTLVTTLRLFKPGVTGTGMVRTCHETDIPLFGGITTGYPSYGEYVGKQYHLPASELEDFRRFWKEIDFTHCNDVALRRFNYSYGRVNPEDKLIDDMIALEALFLEGEKAGTSSKTVIAVGCSTLLGKNREERRRIRKTLMDAYELRNLIVHGSQYCRTKREMKRGTNIDVLSALVSEVENCLRESLKKLLT